MSSVVYAEEEEPRREQKTVREESQPPELEEATARLQATIANVPGIVIGYLRQEFAQTVSKIVDEVRRSVFAQSSGVEIDALRSLGLPTADIEENLGQLKSQVHQDRHQGSLFCQEVREGSFVPVADSVFDYLRAFESPIESEHAPNLTLVPTEKGIEGFCNELDPFITNRLIAGSVSPITGQAAGGMGPPLMLPVRVFSPTSGARVSYSPAYFINYISFAAPTSPAVSQLLPGRYIFMISIRQQRLYDQAIFDIPPSFDVNLIV